MSSPQEIQERIDRTRESLSSDVDRLSDKVSPSKVVGRRVDKFKGSVHSARERVMGSASDTAGNAKATIGGAASSVSDAASGVGEAVSNAPHVARQQTQGNPLAAGLIAFGAGWLIASLAPASSKEQQVAKQLENRASEFAEPVKERVRELAQNLQQPVQEAAQHIKSTATDAAGQTAEHAKSAADDVRSTAQG